VTAGDGRAAAVAARIEEAVRGWREEHLDGTARDMLKAIGADFHKDYGVVLRALLYRASSPAPTVPAGVSIITGDKR